MWPFTKKDDAARGAKTVETARPDSTRNARADLLWKAGSRYLGRKQYLKAIASFQDAFDIEPSRLEGRLNYAVALYLAQRPEEAVGHLRYVLAFEPQNTMALLNLAATYDALGLIDESIATLEKLVADRPNWNDANYNLGVAYAKQDRLDEATAALRRELTLNPKHEAARTLLNDVHLRPRRKKAVETVAADESGEMAPGEMEIDEQSDEESHD